MFGIFKIIDLNAVWEGNVEVISDFCCSSGHVTPKHDMCYVYTSTQRTNAAHIQGVPYKM